MTAGMMLCGLVVTPYLLKYLGSERLGALRSMQQWMGYLEYLNAALCPSIGILLLKAFNSKRQKYALGLTRTAMGLQLWQSVFIVLPVALLLAWLMPWLIPVRGSMRGELRACALLSLSGLLLAPFAIFRIMLECSQLGSIVNFGLLVNSIVTSVVSLWLAWAGWGLVGQSGAVVVGLFAFYCILALSQPYGLHDLRQAEAARLSRKELWTLRWPLTIAGVGNHLNLWSDYIVVSLVMGPTDVTVFLVTQRLLSIVGYLVTAAANSAWPGLANVADVQARSVFGDRLCEVYRLTLALGVVSATTFAAFNRDFVHLWVGDRYYGGALLSVLTAAQLVLFGHLLLFSWLVDMAGDARERVWMSTVGSVANVGLSIVLARKMGLPGVTLGTIVGYLATDAWYTPHVFCKRYKISRKLIALTALRTGILCLPWSVGIWEVGEVIRFSGWAGIGSGVFVALTVGGTYSAFVVLTPNDRARWRILANKIIVTATLRYGMRRWSSAGMRVSKSG